VLARACEDPPTSGENLHRLGGTPASGNTGTTVDPCDPTARRCPGAGLDARLGQSVGRTTDEASRCCRDAAGMLSACRRHAVGRSCSRLDAASFAIPDGGARLLGCPPRRRRDVTPRSGRERRSIHRDRPMFGHATTGGRTQADHGDASAPGSCVAIRTGRDEIRRARVGARPQLWTTMWTERRLR
jgi:hypothetical protein